MAKINGVLGPIDTADLGFTLMHEHILVVNWSLRQAFASWYDRDQHVPHAVSEVLSAKQRGVRTIVDLTPINLGRDIHVIREVAEKAEMQVIAATGFYWTEEPSLAGWPEDRLVELLIRDIEKGIQGTDAKAGIIKCGTDHFGVNRQEPHFWEVYDWFQKQLDEADPLLAGRYDLNRYYHTADGDEPN